MLDEASSESWTKWNRPEDAFAKRKKRINSIVHEVEEKNNLQKIISLFSSEIKLLWHKPRGEKVARTSFE